MKKLMLAVAAVAAVCTVNAAQFYWGGEAQIIDGYTGGTGETGVDGVGYFLWDNATGGLTYSAAQAILDDWSAGKVADLSGITGKAFAQDEGFSDPAEVGGGSFESNTASGLAATAGNYYGLFITEDNDGRQWAYLSSELAIASIEEYGATEAIFTGEAALSAAGTGWYGAYVEPEPTPEPTSGLLLLIGMAGLALRRRRA